MAKTEETKTFRVDLIVAIRRQILCCEMVEPGEGEDERVMRKQVKWCHMKLW